MRRAVGHLVDRQSIESFIYGRLGTATTNFINNPARYRSAGTTAEFNVGKAAALLDDAGWKAGSDGIREKGGKKLKLLFQASIGAPTQKLQAVFKQAAQKAGIEVELKAVVASVFFSSDVGNPDTYGKFLADMQTYNWSNASPDPEGLMQCFVSWEVCAKANKWLGQNLVRWQNARIRRPLPRRRGRARPGQARGALHPHERPRRRRRLRRCRSSTARRHAR